MPPRSWRVRIGDILDAVARIQRYADGMDHEAFYADDRSVDAVVYNLIVIGEAARLVPEEVVARTAAIPWARMRGMRNVLAHEYFGIDRAVVWTTIRQNLPPIVPLLQALLDEDS